MPDGVSVQPLIPPAKNLGGRPVWQPTAEQRRTVMLLRAGRNDIGTIARVIGGTRTTLRKACGEELKHGFEMVKAHISATLVRSALAGNVLAQRYWLATHGGPEWRIPHEAENRRYA
jgi:hypothetical protein